MKVNSMQKDIASVIENFHTLKGNQDYPNIYNDLKELIQGRSKELENAIKTQNIVRLIELSSDKGSTMMFLDGKEKAFTTSFKVVIDQVLNNPEFFEFAKGLDTFKSLLNDLTTSCMGCLGCLKRKARTQLRYCVNCLGASIICKNCPTVCKRCSGWHIDPVTKGSTFSLSNNNLTATSSNCSNCEYVAGNMPFKKGIYKFDVTYTGCGCGGYQRFGVILEDKFKEVRSANVSNIVPHIIGIGISDGRSESMVGTSNVSSGQTMTILVDLIKGELKITGPNGTSATGLLNTSISYLPCFHCCYDSPATVTIKPISEFTPFQ